MAQARGITAGPKRIQPPPAWVSVGPSFPQWLVHQLREAHSLSFGFTLHPRGSLTASLVFAQR